MDWLNLISTVVVALCSLAGAFLASSKQTALIGYRIEQLEKKVEKHNSVVERTYKLERDVGTLGLKIDAERSGLEKLESELHEHESKA